MRWLDFSFCVDHFGVNTENCEKIFSDILTQERKSIARLWKHFVIIHLKIAENIGDSLKHEVNFRPDEAYHFGEMHHRRL
jgi:hypothetical protein